MPTKPLSNEARLRLNNLLPAGGRDNMVEAANSHTTSSLVLRLVSEANPPQAAPTNPLPPAVRQRLDQLFVHGKKSLDKGDCEYAHDLFTQCVTEDPGNVGYLQHFRANLVKQHGQIKKKKSLTGYQAKNSPVAKANAKGDWTVAFQMGCQALKKNPADLAVLRDLAEACAELGHEECRLFYLRWALDIDSQDLETNRHAAAALEKVTQYDQAIACWQRVLQKKPDDQEARNAVSRLSVEKTIQKGGYNNEAMHGSTGAPDMKLARVADLAARHSADLESNTGPPPFNPPVEAPEAQDNRTEEQRLLDEINAQPDEPSRYLVLADRMVAADRLQEAERLLIKAGTLSRDQAILERLEDVRLRRGHQQVTIARQRLANSPSDLAQETVQRAVAQANQIEVEVFTARAARQPNKPELQFELGLRLKRIGRHREAIKAFQAARGDSRRTAETQLNLGECFQQIEQYKLAMSSYKNSVEASETAISTDISDELRKLALYRAGVLAMGMKELEQAEKWLTDLAALDFAYRDVADRLDKIARIRHDA